MKNILICKAPTLSVTHFIEDLSVEEIHKYADERLEEGTKYAISTVSEMLSDRTFREAWDIDDSELSNVAIGDKNGSIISKGLKVDLQRAKDIVHDARREACAKELAPYDEIIMKQVPGGDYDEAESKRAEIRTKYTAIQAEVDACADTAQLKEKLEQLN